MAKKRPPQKSSTAKKRSPQAASSDALGVQRLNKILAAAGLGSRRKVEELIEQGRVEIDGEIVTDLARKVDPAAVKIKVDGTLLKKSRPVYYALNKPPGVLSTNFDPSGRMRVIDLVPDRDRVFSVGRLDQSSEGLMLLTNDGDLAQKLAHPKFRIQKAYFVVVSGQMTAEELAKLRKGVHLAEGFARIDGATIKKHRKGCTEIEIVLSEGKNREIRRILARAGHKVVLLRRIAIGPLRLGQLPVGASRPLNSAEVKALYAAADPSKRPKKKPSSLSSKKPGAPTKKTAVAADDVDDEDQDDLLSLQFEGSDDDYDGDFSGVGNVGSVISYDDDVSMPAVDRTSRDSSSARPKSRSATTKTANRKPAAASKRARSSHGSSRQANAASSPKGRGQSKKSSSRPATSPRGRNKPAKKKGKR